MALIGVISDTHGLIRDDALRALSGVDFIIHAGDVGKPAVLDALRRLAPLHVVRGNVDTGAWAANLPSTTTLNVQDVRIFVVHDIADLEFDPATGGFAAIIFGHSHKAVQELRNGVLYLNPGSAGPRRFRRPATLARMKVDGAPIHCEIVLLDGS